MEEKWIKKDGTHMYSYVNENKDRKQKEVSTEHSNYFGVILILILVIGITTLIINGENANFSVKNLLITLSSKADQLVPMNEILNFKGTNEALEMVKNGWSLLTQTKVNSLDTFFKATANFFKILYDFVFVFFFKLGIDILNVFTSIIKNLIVLFQIITLQQN